MSRRVTVVIACDHTGCPAEYTGTAGKIHALAEAAGWLTGAIDACPDHWNRIHPEDTHGT